MKLILGLGNPGLKYAWTRHNAGRLLVEFVARENILKPAVKKKLKASLVSFNWSGQSVLLAYPETYMNTSGECVRALLDYYSIDPSQDLLVVVDDYALPFGKMRLRLQGSAGGHNGLKSIEAFLGGQNYPRLRLGIGPDQGATGSSEDLKEYVLDPFTRGEKASLEPFLIRASQACQAWLMEPPEKAMMRVNSDDSEKK